jgi:hypothetical protein
LACIRDDFAVFAPNVVDRSVMAEHTPEKDLDNIALCLFLGIVLFGFTGVVDKLLVRSKLLDLVSSPTSIHQVNNIDMNILQRLENTQEPKNNKIISQWTRKETALFVDT